VNQLLRALRILAANGAESTSVETKRKKAQIRVEITAAKMNLCWTSTSVTVEHNFQPEIAEQNA
jgi:hypothetical protein